MCFLIIASILISITGTSLEDSQTEEISISEFREFTSGVYCAADIFSTLGVENDFVSNTLLTANILYPDSVARHFYFVIPPGYDPEEKSPLFVWLHGGVSTPDLRIMDPTSFSEWHLIPRLLEEGYLIVFPCAQLDAVWWDTVGEAGIMSIVQWMKSTFRIHDSRIFVGGFSDGASGSFSLMMLHPDNFAAYTAFSGHIGVAALSDDRGTYLPSLYNRPGIVTHSDEDGLYPAAKMAPTITLAEEAGARIEYHTFSGFRHDPSYLPQIEDRVIEFLGETERIRFPEKIIWEAGEPSGCDWLMVDSIISWPLIGEDRDYNTLLVYDRLQFGFYQDRAYEGNGILIAGTLDDDVPAARLGLTEGDIITGFMDEPVSTLEDIDLLQSEMRAGDWFSIEIQRDGETIYLEDSFNPPVYYWLFPRQNPSVRVEAACSDNQFDVTVNRFCRIRLLLHPEMVDFSNDIVVTCNDLEIFRGRVSEDGNFAMSNLMANLDVERCYTAELKLDLEEIMTSLMYHRTDSE